MQNEIYATVDPTVEAWIEGKASDPIVFNVTIDDIWDVALNMDDEDFSQCNTTRDEVFDNPEILTTICRQIQKKLGSSIWPTIDDTIFDTLCRLVEEGEE